LFKISILNILKIKPIGKKVIINIRNITNGDIILLRSMPKLFQILLGIINIFENLNEINKSTKDNIIDQILILESNKRGYKEIIRKTNEKKIPNFFSLEYSILKKLLFSIIIIFVYFYITLIIIKVIFNY
tara:strand:- start:704 stop:1093 length:390 start_codon:yes stop_codon:yes gene_type:complete